MDSYEKKYKDALEKARQLCVYPTSKPFISDLQDLFPELAESEDERIRKELIKVFSNRKKYLIDQSFGDITVSEVLAWLERQKAIDVLDAEEREFADNVNSYRKDMDEFYKKGYDAGREAERQYWLGKQGKNNKWKPSKNEMDALYGLAYITNKMDDKKDEAITKLYQDLKREFFDGTSYENMFPLSPVDAPIKDEKQGEQKPADKVYPKIKVGDWVVDNQGRVNQVTSVTDDGYGFALYDGTYVSGCWKDYYHLWTIQDAKDGDVLAAHECYVIFKEIVGLNIKCYCTYHYMNNPSFYVDTLQNKDAFYPATKEQRDQLEKAMADAGYTFDFKRKELKKIEQKPIDKDEILNILNKENQQVQQEDLIMKPSLNTEQNSAWSEEDEKMVSKLLTPFATRYPFETYQPMYDWLKSIKDRVGCEANCTSTKEWSEEDMSKVQRICKYLDEAKKYYADITEIRECMDWLKSLRPHKQ